MKKYLLFVAAMAATVALTSCEKNEAAREQSVDNPGSWPVVEMSFGTEVESRAFGSGATESWEKQVNSATVLVFNASGGLVFRRELTAGEITTIATTPISIIVQGGAAGDNCDFAVVANRAVPMSVSSKTLLLAELEADGSSYNGTFAEVTTKSKRTGGFAMSGLTTKAISSGSTAVTIVLKRTVAKVEVVSRTTAAFTAKYGNATITIDKVTLSQSATNCHLIDQSKYGAGGTNDVYEQSASSGKSLFYIFEKAAAAAGSRVKLTLDAVYDADGSAGTSTDRVSLAYDVEMEGITNGQIKRNGAYLVNVNIDGLLGSDVTATVTVADWETLVTQNINVGK